MKRPAANLIVELIFWSFAVLVWLICRPFDHNPRQDDDL